MRMRYVVAVALAAGMFAVVQAQPGSGFGFGGGPVMLVANKAVQEDLKVTEEQAAKLKEWSKEYGGKVGEMMKEKFKDIPKEQFREKFAEIQTEMSKEAYKQLGDVLKKDQIDRLHQIERQQMNVRAFSDADVVAALKLTDSQKSSIKGINSDYQKEAQELRGTGGKGRGKGFDPETQKKMAKLQKESMGKILDILEDDQKKTWKSLTGAEFDLTKLQFQRPKQKD